MSLIITGVQWSIEPGTNDMLVNFTVTSDIPGLFDLSSTIDGTDYAATGGGTSQPAGSKTYIIRLYDVWEGANPQFDPAQSHNICLDLINVRAE